MPKHISSFIDIMGGAFNVGINVVANQVIYNEYLPHTYDIIKLLLSKNKDEIIRQIEEITEKYTLNKGDKTSYLTLREQYNQTKDIFQLFVLHMYCLQNQMRFNSKLEFNFPVGNCSYNETLKERIKLFTPKTKDYKLLNKSYYHINFLEYDKDSIFYFIRPILLQMQHIMMVSVALLVGMQRKKQNYWIILQIYIFMDINLFYLM